jgi:NAD(P)H-dependent flavin oxidoreductase YrpB (nitropropane dioxygenase family)
VASFAQAPGQATVARLKEAGVVVIPTIGARRHAEKVAEWGVDAVIAQGTEGGGHTGVVPTSLLIPQVLDAVDLPVIAAGGFVDGRGLAAALAWGADGIAMGTRFLLTSDSSVPDNVKALYLATPVTGTVVTTAIDGAPQRVIATDMIRRLEAARLTRFPRAAANALRFRRLTGTSMRALLAEGIRMKKAQDLTWGQMALAANAPMLTRATMVDGRTEVGILPTGQGVGSIDELPSVADLVARIVAEATETLDRLCGG